MARYIDADELLGRLPDNLPYKASVKRVLIQVPTADVVPRSEVEELHRVIGENAQRALEVTLEEIEKAEVEVAREIFAEIGKFVCTNEEDYRKFVELKKKYTGE